jgi:hypothetical protein
MEKLNQKKVTIATGLTSVAIYLGCFLLMLIAGKEGLVKISNLLFHSMDFTNIIRTEMPLLETLFGAIISSIFGAWRFTYLHLFITK